MLPNPPGDFACAAADCCSRCQLSGCSGVPSVTPRRDLPPTRDGVSLDSAAVGHWVANTRWLLCPTRARSKSCSALVKPSIVSRLPDLAIFACWKCSLFCPAFVSSQLLVIFHGVSPCYSCAAQGCWCKLSFRARACSAERLSVRAGLFRVLPSTSGP